MDIGFFIEYEGEVVQFPVNPDKVTISTAGNNKSSEIISIGEITLIKKRKLTTIAWQSFLPQQSWFPAIRTMGNFKGIDFYLSFINRIREDCKPCRLVITGIGVSSKVSIESFEYYHQGGDHEDCYYSINLKEYKDYVISKISIDQTQADRGTTSLQKQRTQPNARDVNKAGVVAAEVTVGCEVILSGRVHYDSYGARPGRTFTNYRGKVNLVNKQGSHPYHVTTPAGGWLGWVEPESVKLA